ncbi:MAG TPA: ABC transporter permease [Puia sp.]|nr:ABC transporter permease [Puia sp.]
MLKNYFIVAWRNLFRNRASSIINIGGLAVGMAVALLIGLWIHDEYSYNKYHRNYDRIARVIQSQTRNGVRNVDYGISFPVAPGLRKNFGGDFKHVVPASWEEDHILTTGDNKFSIHGIYMDKEAPAMLTLRMLRGSYDGLANPQSILLAASTAKALFGATDPVGARMKIDNKLDVTVTGVYEDLPDNSEFRGDKFIAPWDLYITSERWIKENFDQWDNNYYQLYVQLADHADIDAVDRKIAGFKQAHVAPVDKKLQTILSLFPMRDWHLRAHWENDGRQSGGLIEYVRLFGTIGVFVLLLACINFMNLSTARSERRAKEVGIRKSIGSLRSQLIGQFYSESMLVVVLAYTLALCVVQLILPWFNQVASKRLAMPWADPAFWLLGLSFILLTAIVAGSYPALYLSSFRPVKVLKGAFKAGRLAAVPRKALVVLQFTISMTLIIGTLVVYRQIRYSQQRPLGFDREALMMVQMKSHDYFGIYGTLENELKRTGAIEEMAESSSPITGVWSSSDDFQWPGYDPGVDADFGTISVTHDFGKTVGWRIKEGRDFSREFKTDSASLILNEAAVRSMDLKNPVGTVIRRGYGAYARSYTVVGVAADMVMESPYDNVRPTIYFMDYENVNWMLFRLNRNLNVHESVARVGAAFRKVLPAVPFDYKFADNEYTAKFAAEERTGALAIFFTILAVFISCIGLFGLASFVAEQRTKEIGIRKVLGATVTTLWALLSKDFLKLVAIACLVAIPVAWIAMHGWLRNYTYRTPIAWWIFAATGCGALGLTLLTVSFQAIRAALANPVKSLRSE